MIANLSQRARAYSVSLREWVLEGQYRQRMLEHQERHRLWNSQIQTHSAAAVAYQ